MAQFVDVLLRGFLGLAAFLFVRNDPARVGRGPGIDLADVSGRRRSAAPLLSGGVNAMGSVSG
jgi:hypothetical protein